MPCITLLTHSKHFELTVHSEMITKLIWMHVFAYNWKLPAYSGAFLLTIDNFSFFAYNWSFFAYNFSFLLTVGTFLLTVGKCV